MIDLDALRARVGAATGPIPATEWVWYGYAGHLIVGKSCAYHLCTRPRFGTRLLALMSPLERRAIRTIAIGLAIGAVLWLGQLAGLWEVFG